MHPTNSSSGTAFRRGASQLAPMEPDQEICGGEDKIGEGESAPEAEPVGSRTAEDGEEPYHAAKNSRQGSSLLGGKIQLFLEIESKGRKGTVVRKTLEDLADIGDPEGRFEAGTNLLQAVGKCQCSSRSFVARGNLPVSRSPAARAVSRRKGR